MAVYKTSLPSMHLSGKDLKEFESVFKQDSTNPDFGLVIEKNGFRYSLDSVDEFLNDFEIPDITTEYKLVLNCKEGKVSIDTTYSGKGNLRISGNKDWVHKKKRIVSEQVNKNKKLLRTHSTKIIGASAVLFWVIFEALSFSNTGSEQVNMTFYEGLIVVILLIGIISWPFILIGGQSYVSPYNLIKRDDSIYYRPRFYKAVKVGVSLLGIIGSVGGIYTLMKFLQ